MRRPAVAVIIAGAIWAAAVGTGMAVLTSFTNEPGVAAHPPVLWPSDSQIRPAVGRATLVMLIHPRCPCSRASIEELDRLMAQGGASLSAKVLFVKPPGVADNWEQTDTWRHAAAIPGVEVVCDNGAVEARRFGAATSGQVVLYGSDGHLRFSGGITSARGHAGDNRGRSAILELLRAELGADAGAPVFGCPLERPDAASAAIEAKRVL